MRFNEYVASVQVTNVWDILQNTGHFLIWAGKPLTQPFHALVTEWLKCFVGSG